MQDALRTWGREPTQLLQVLRQTQEPLGFLPPQALERIAAELEVPIARVRGVTAFYSFLYPESPGAYRVQVTGGVGGYALAGDPDQPGAPCTVCDGTTTTPIVLRDSLDLPAPASITGRPTDGTVDLDLSAMGASPTHKDVFLEIDWLADQAAPCAGCHKPRDVSGLHLIDLASPARTPFLAAPLALVLIFKPLHAVQRLGVVAEMLHQLLLVSLWT